MHSSRVAARTTSLATIESYQAGIGGAGAKRVVAADRVRHRPVEHGAAARQEFVGGRLGAQAHLDRVARRSAPRSWRSGQRLAARDAQLPLDEVEPRDAFGDGVLHLQPRVHLHEVEVARAIEQELHRARAHVADLAGDGDRGGAHARAQRRRRRRARAIPRSPSGGGAARSSRARPGAARCRARRRTPAPRRGAARRWRARGSAGRHRRPSLPPRPRSAARRAGAPASSTRRMPRPPPPAAAFTMTGNPIRAASRAQRARRPGRRRRSRARPGCPAAAMRCRARALSPMASIADGRRADEDEARLEHGASERRAFCEEAVARDGSRRPLPRGRRRAACRCAGSCRPRRRRPAATASSQRSHVRIGRVGVGIDRDGRDAHAVAPCARCAGRSRRGSRSAGVARASSELRQRRHADVPRRRPAFATGVDPLAGVSRAQQHGEVPRGRVQRRARAAPTGCAASCASWRAVPPARPACSGASSAATATSVRLRRVTTRSTRPTASAACGIESRRRQQVPARRAQPQAPRDEGRDLRRGQAQRHLRHGEHRVVRRDHAVHRRRRGRRRHPSPRRARRRA